MKYKNCLVEKIRKLERENAELKERIIKLESEHIFIAYPFYPANPWVPVLPKSDPIYPFEPTIYCR